MTTNQRTKSQRLVTTTPLTSVGEELKSIKHKISKDLFDGISVRKISSKGELANRVLTISDDLFLLFISHHKVGSKESIKDRFNYQGFKAYSKAVTTLTGRGVQAKHNLKVIDVSDILFVAHGHVCSQKLEFAEKKTKKDEARRIISIYHNNAITTDFITESDEEKVEVLNAIELIRKVYQKYKSYVGREELLLRYAWYDTDMNKSGLVDQEEFLMLLQRINVYLKKEKAVRIFKDSIKSAKNETKTTNRLGSKSGRQGITFDECIALLREISLRENESSMSDTIFDELFGKDNDTVSAEDFLAKFIREKQTENSVTLDDVSCIFSELNSMEISGSVSHSGEEGFIDRMRFQEYLMSARNEAYDPAKTRFDAEKMDRPITDFWVDSSHNTYLQGDQLKSYSTVQMYVVALHRGCKCLELDCWDDNGTGTPVIFHGHTLTSKISFSSVITCVKKYVDEHPDTMPIILSLENHCSLPFQEQMADTLERTLGSNLYIPDPNGELPSPSRLVGLVLIKGKQIEDGDATETTASSFEDDETGALEEQIHLSLRVGGAAKGREQPLPDIVPELSRLTLFNGIKFKSFADSSNLNPHDMHSFSETKALKILNNPLNCDQWREYNTNHMSRVYPKGIRTDSSNYNPLPAWHAGCQLVALNYQTEDSSMALNVARFRENGRCGYIPRPPRTFLTGKEESMRPEAALVSIKALSGSCLPKPYGESKGEVIDPYLTVKLYDVNINDEHDIVSTIEYRTSAVRNNGFCPIWNSDTFTFTVRCPEIAFVEFTVMDCDHGFLDDFMCRAAIPVNCLRNGIRCIQFFDKCSQQHGPLGMARVLVDIDVKYEL